MSASGGLSNLMEAATALAKLTDSLPMETSPGIVVPASSNFNQAARRHVISDEEQEIKKTKVVKATKEIFPERLMAILNDATLTDIVTWLPHGRSFVIVRPDVFTEQVLPKYLPPVDSRSSTKYPSFTRKLNRWGFRQATRGPDTGAFHHPLFRRDKPELCLGMVCQRSRDRKNTNKKTLPAKKRKVAILTQESLHAFDQSSQPDVAPTTTQTSERGPVAVSNDDSQSMRSSLSSEVVASANSQASSTADLQQRNVTADTNLTQKAIAQRNEEERIRVAKAMLYHAYLQAVQHRG